ncbi:hypothetical protein LZ32DRAFT_186135 [Colletotrichum eremochloae]|nr:hypothetical protein LZ32DRAFT_186135 [Colletotrichum eremochloae]
MQVGQDHRMLLCMVPCTMPCRYMPVQMSRQVYRAFESTDTMSCVLRATSSLKSEAEDKLWGTSSWKLYVRYYLGKVTCRLYKVRRPAMGRPCRGVGVSGGVSVFTLKKAKKRPDKGRWRQMIDHRLGMWHSTSGRQALQEKETIVGIRKTMAKREWPSVSPQS